MTISAACYTEKGVFRIAKGEGTNVNFQNLEYFLTVAEEGNITRAAERLHISQQALSGQIARLESELGCELFTRRGGLELTYSGKCLRHSAEQILDIKRQTVSVINDANENRRGELRIGISYTRGQAILPKILPEFSRLYPHAEISIFEGSTEKLEDDLDKGQIDILIGFSPFLLETAEYMPLIREKMYLVAQKELLRDSFGERTESVLAAYRKKPDITVFRDIPFVLLKKGDRIRSLVDQEFAQRRIDPVIKLETANIQTAFCLAAEGVGLTVCPEMYLKSGYVVAGIADYGLRRKVEILPFFSGDITDTIAIGYNRTRYLSRMAQDFIEFSRRQFSPEDPF